MRRPFLRASTRRFLRVDGVEAEPSHTPSPRPVAATPSTRCSTHRWLKITSVYSVVATGRHALFQDADVVWLRDPIEYFFTQADDQVDCFFMDDGARSARYTPLYTNSGFYFIRNNMRTQFFMHRMLMAYDTVLAVRSHQHALICVEIKFYGAVALNLRVDLHAIDAPPCSMAWRMPVPHRSTDPGGPRHRREMT